MIDMDRSWLDFTPQEAFDLAMRLVPMASKINFDVRPHGDGTPTFRIGCQVLGRDDTVRNLAALEEVGIRAIFDDGRSFRFGRLDSPSES